MNVTLSGNRAFTDVIKVKVRSYCFSRFLKSVITGVFIRRVSVCIQKFLLMVKMGRKSV